MNNFISVVIPTYNGSAFIADALTSVFAQTLPPQEIIVVDDCSRDETVAIVEKIACRARIPIRLMRLSCNSGGPAKPINVGVAAARSELIAVLDQDDLFAPDKLQHECQLLSQNPDAVIAGGMVNLDFSRNQSCPEPFDKFRKVDANGNLEPLCIPGGEMLAQLLIRGMFLLGYPAFSFRKTHWEAKGGIDEGLLVASDYDFLCWLCSRGSVILRPEVHYVRREHEFNVCNNRLNVFLDMTRVRARHLLLNSWLLNDEKFVKSLRDWFNTFSYWAREAGEYRSALECNYLAGKIWGWDAFLVKSTAKVAFHWLWCKFTGRKKIVTPFTTKRLPTSGETHQNRKSTAPVSSTI